MCCWVFQVCCRQTRRPIRHALLWLIFPIRGQRRNMYLHTISSFPRALEINSHQRVQRVDSVGNVPERLFANGLYFTKARLKIATYHSPRFEVSASRENRGTCRRGQSRCTRGGGLLHLPDDAASLHCVWHHRDWPLQQVYLFSRLALTSNRGE